ncbi:MAG: extracellular solute-binding protein [Chloroflexi bacterium]|nr:extracellular solute-binding protein [Chloroflexota bacterium]
MKQPASRSKLSRRDFLRVSGLTTLALGVVACAPAAPAGQPAASSGGQAAAPATAATELRWVTNHASIEIPGFEKIAQGFSEKNPNIKVNLLNIPDGNDFLNAINTQGVGGQLPDIFYTRTFDVVPFASKGWTTNLQPLVDRDAAEVNVKDFWPAEVEQMTYEGSLYALPYDFSNIGIVYNKSILDEVGVPAPTGDWTWSEMFDVAAKLVKKDGDKTTRWGMAVYPWSWVWIGILYANGGKLFSEDNKQCIINSKENQETFEFFVKQRLAGVYPEGGALPQGVDPFASGLVAMGFEGSWATQGRRESIGDKFPFDVTYFPKGSTGKRAISAAGGAWGIAANSKATEQAWAFNKFLTSTDSTNKLISEPVRSIPSRQSSVPAWNKAASAANASPKSVHIFADQMTDAWAQPFPAFWKDFDVAWTNRIVPMLNGGEGADTDVAGVLTQFQDEVNTIIKQSGA